MAVYLIATLDTKGHEAQFLREQLRALEIETKLIDAGCLGLPQVTPDISRDDVFAAVGSSQPELLAKGDRGAAVTAAAAGVTEVIRNAFLTGDVEGVLSIGGSAGTTIGTQAMRSLPLGIPKVMVSTLASGDVRGFVGVADIMMLNSVVDIAGVNRVSRLILSEAAAAMAGMVRLRLPDNPVGDKPIIAATMFGVTTPCIEHARPILEAAGCEVLVFHATGSGGQAMERLIQDGLVVGVLDITTTEIADEIVGGVLSAGPERLTAAGKRGIPQVVSVGATDMVNFWAMNSVPAPLNNRQLYKHNDNVTLMRTTDEECFKIGLDIGRKLAAATGSVAVLLPRHGVSTIDMVGQPFNDEVARRTLFDAIRGESASSACEVIELDAHINDQAFAEFAATKLLELLGLSR